MRTLLLTLLVGCANLKQATITGTIAASATVLCDYGQTMWHANRKWVTHSETNPILGPTPEPLEVTGYFAGAVVVGTLALLVMPDWLRPTGLFGVIVIESKAISVNVQEGTPLCGI